MQKQTLLRISIVGLLFSCCQGSQAGLINPGFEQPYIGGSPTYAVLDASLVTGWSTTASDNQMELWANGFLGVAAYEGTQFAELNANEVSTLYQDVSGIAAGSPVGWQLAHRGRDGVDTLALVITDLGTNNILGGGDDTVLFTRQFSDDNTAWGFYEGNGLTALGNTIRYAFVSVSAAGGNQAIGNFLDAVDFGTGVGGPVAAVPEPTSLAMTGLVVVPWAARSWRRRRQGSAG